MTAQASQIMLYIVSTLLALVISIGGAYVRRLCVQLDEQKKAIADGEVKAVALELKVNSISEHCNACSKNLLNEDSIRTIMREELTNAFNTFELTLINDGRMAPKKNKPV